MKIHIGSKRTATLQLHSLNLFIIENANAASPIDQSYILGK